MDNELRWWKDLYYGGQLGQEGIDWDLLWFANLSAVVGVTLPKEELNMDFSTPAIADVDADGDLDIVVASRTGYVYVIDGITGTFLSWFYVGKTSTSVAVANINDDPYLEIFIGTTDSTFNALRWNPTQTPPGLEIMWTHTVSPVSVIFSSAAIGDIDADGQLEVVFGTAAGIRVLDTITGNQEWDPQKGLTGGDVFSSPALASRTSVNRWEMTWPFFRGNIRRTGYIPGSGEELSIYVGSNDSYMYLFNGVNGDLIDRFYVDPRDIIQSSPVLGDIDGDNKIEAHVLTSYRDIGIPPQFWSIKDTGSSGPSDTTCGEPVADFGWWPLKPMEGQEISFTDLSYDTMGEIVQWEWNFNHPGYPGGGPFDTQQNPKHTYGDNGFFQVTLKVWDDDSNSASVTKTIEVINADPELEVWLSALAGSEQRTHGYWKHQCWIEEENRQEEEHPGISPFLNFIRSHSRVWANTDFDEVCADLRFAGNEQPQKLRKQLIAVWLNVASYKLFLDSPLHHPLTSSNTIGAFLFEAEEAIIQGWPSEYNRLHNIATDINEDAGRHWYVPPVAGLYTARVTDPGSDDLTFIWDCRDGMTFTIIVYNNGLSPDPYPSPDGTYPFIVENSVTCEYPYPPNTFRPDLTVMDDDGGKAQDEDPGQLWSADFTFVYTIEWRDIGYGFIVADVTVTYLDWDSCVVPIDPTTGQPIGGEGGKSGSGKQTGEGPSGIGSNEEEAVP